MSGLTPFPYYNDLHDTRFAGLGLTEDDFKLDSAFKVKKIKPIDKPRKGSPPTYDIPLHRFNFLNKKLREFPVKEENIKLIDFNDGFGEVYAYRWKNDPGQGMVGFMMKFDNDKNIDITSGSRVGTGCQLFSKNGTISITKSTLKNCTIFATGDVKIDKCDLENCYIFGKGDISKVNCKARIKLIGSFSVNECSISENAPFLIYNPDELNQSPTTLNKTSLSSPCELIGGVSLDLCTITGPVRIQGKSTFKQTQFSGNVQVNSIDVSCTQSQLSDNCVLSQSCTLNQSTVSGTALIGGKATVSNATVSGTAIIVGSATLSNGSASGGILTQSGTLSGGSISDHGLITGTSTVSGSVSEDGIVGGSGTQCSSGVMGLVANGVSCSHGVAAGQSHWDKRSCEETQKNKLEDERRDNTSPGHSDADQSAEPTTV